MAKQYDLARMSTATTGTGTITLGSAVTINGVTYLTFALAGVQDGDTVSYGIADTGASEVGSGVYTASGTTLTRSPTSSTNGNAAINLSGSAQVFIMPRARDMLLPGMAQTFSTTDQTQARSNISAAQLAAMAAHNVALNGAVDSSIELGSTLIQLVNNTAKYTADAWEGYYNHAANTAVVTSAQTAITSIGTLAGFQFAHMVAAPTAITSPASGDFARHRQKIEGRRIAHWGWGASGASAIVVAFELFSTVAGTLFVKLSNSDQSRCYYHEIAAGVGWTFFALNVAGDTSGTWQTTFLTGLVFEVFSAGKETTPASVLDTWGSTNKVQTTNSVNVLNANSHLTAITGLYIDVGTQLPLAADLPSLMRPADQEVWLCGRYTQHVNVQLSAIDSLHPGGGFQFAPTMRAAPNQLSGTFAANAGSNGTVTVNATMATGAYVFNADNNWTPTAIITYDGVFESRL